jgi:cytochrome c-type biogenesis protein CcmH
VSAARRSLRPLACAAALALASAAAAQTSPAGAAAPPKFEPRWGYALGDELMSPWCPGFALPDCGSDNASQLRLWILEQERLGRSEDDVRAEILAKYGEKILQRPPPRGRALVAYLGPATRVLAGLGVLVAFLPKQGATKAAPGASAGAAAGAADPSALAQVDAELARLERAND